MFKQFCEDMVEDEEFNKFNKSFSLATSGSDFQSNY